MTGTGASGGSSRYLFPEPLLGGVIINRPNRFVMLVHFEGRTVRCHCPTTGRIGDLKVDGLPCLISRATGAGRKTAYTVEAISTVSSRGPWIGINQTAANRYLEFFIRRGRLSKMVSGPVRREVRLRDSRIDFLVGNAYVEVKTPLISPPNEGAREQKPAGRFDSFDRLIKHMRVLRGSLSSGKRAVILLCYLYDAKPFRPPPRDRTNSRIASAASKTEKAGVERWQVNLRIDPTGVTLLRYFRSPRDRDQ